MEERLETTLFAPAARASLMELSNDVRIVAPKTGGDPFLDVSPALLLVLNAQRQIIYANQAVLHFLGIKDPASVIGKRPGEAFNCVNSAGAPNGCGTGEACKSCAAVLSIMECLEHEKLSIGECRLLRNFEGGSEALDLRVSSSPLPLEGRSYVVFTAVDIGDERRRNYLEGVFIHEIRNSAGNVLTLSGLLKDELGDSQANETAAMLIHAATRLLSEIDGHRTLIEAETGALKLEPVSFSSAQLLQRLATEYAKGPYGEGKDIRALKDSLDVAISGDPVILSRALGNLIRNSLEASKPGETVALSCEAGAEKERAVFRIACAATLSHDVQLELSKRNLRQRETAKGIGTYMARLLVERYLGGKFELKLLPEGGSAYLVGIPVEGRDRHSSLEAVRP
jgi:hypothetical protein